MDLRIDFDQTLSTGRQVIASGENFQEQLDKVKRANTTLQQYWEGTDASKYSSQVEQQAKQMQELADTIKEIGNFLIEVGNAYKKVSEENANAIK